MAEPLDDKVVLVVDDTEANVLLLERVLRRAGVGRVVGLTDPRDVVAQYQALEPDLIMLDMHMPHLDGVEVLEALAPLIPAGSYVPVLVLTADTTLEARQRALAAGARDFVTKPFEQTEVVLRVRNLLETRALHVALQRRNAELQAEVDVTAEHIRAIARAEEQRVARVRRVLDEGDVTMVFQPIVDLSSERLMGVEALARFTAEPQRPPNEWFAEAAAVGWGAELELLAVTEAVAQLDRLPDDAYLSVNAVTFAALHPRLAEVLRPVAGRIVLELTEHDHVDEYADLLDALSALRRDGVRLAVDDAGSGYASLQHILRVHPDVIKLDIELTRGIDGDPARRALAASLVMFAAEIGATLTAEGIETAAELATLRQLQVHCGQGYHLARPGPLSARTVLSA